MEITSHRMLNGHHALKDGSGRVVGEAWRWPNKSRGFGLRLNGVYWVNGLPNLRGGMTTRSCNSLGGAKSVAGSALAELCVSRGDEVSVHEDFTVIQRAVLMSYADGAHVGLQSMSDVEQCGDTLLLFLMRELASSQGCDCFEEARHRLSIAQKQMETVKLRLEQVATPDV
jgi:hypothetical protein